MKSFLLHLYRVHSKWDIVILRSKSAGLVNFVILLQLADFFDIFLVERV